MTGCESAHSVSQLMHEPLGKPDRNGWLSTARRQAVQKNHGHHSSGQAVEGEIWIGRRQ
jgi:hypothetical protein